MWPLVTQVTAQKDNNIVSKIRYEQSPEKRDTLQVLYSGFQVSSLWDDYHLFFLNQLVKCTVKLEYWGPLDRKNWHVNSSYF